MPKEADADVSEMDEVDVLDGVIDVNYDSPTRLDFI